jgi:t-SNARE complex subunit (syntaxin)
MLKRLDQKLTASFVRPQQQQLQAQVVPDYEIEFQEGLIQEREGDIREIERNIHEINEIFRDLGSIVTEQQSMIGEFPFT